MADDNEVSSKYYTKLRVYPKRKWGFFFFCFLFGSIFASLIFKDLVMGHTWLASAVPIGFLGFLLLVYPTTEEWEYVPWQAEAQQYERHFND